MKYRLIVSIILIIALLLSITAVAFGKNPNNTGKSENFFTRIKISFQTAWRNLGQFFSGAKNKTVQKTKSTRQNVVSDFKEAKNKTVKSAKTAGKSVVTGFKGAKKKVKQDAKTVKQKFIKGFKSIKN